MNHLEPFETEHHPLPSPQRQGRYALEEVFSRRRSQRNFAPEALSAAEIGQLLWAAQGITHPEGMRTAPSCGACYPLQLYVADERGIQTYIPQTHALRRTVWGDRRDLLARSAYEQTSLGTAPLMIVVTAQLDSLHHRYGGVAARYAAMEAGHAVQNLLLQATALDLVAVPVASMRVELVHDLVQAGSDELPLYLVPVGHPRKG